MNWEAIGAIGELLGALAVVLTIGYLAVQVRQNTRGMKVAAKLEITKQHSEYTDLILLNPELFDLQTKGRSGEDLSEIEWARFSLLMQRATWHFSSMHYQYRAQALSAEEWYESQRLIDWFTLAPGYRSWWDKNAINYSADFRNYVNENFGSKGAKHS